MLKLLTPYPAVLVKHKKTKVLVIADLHLGWEMVLSERGIHVPTQTHKLLNKLIEIIAKHKPQKLLILGDVKHTVATAEVSEWQDIPEFFNRLRTLLDEIWLIRGNHDGNLEPLLPEKIKILPSTGTIIGDAGFFHGHRWPSPTLLKCNTLIMGHVHPTVSFRDPAGFRITKQVWVKVKCNTAQLARILISKSDLKIRNNPEETLKYYKIKPVTSQLLIMPSFNEFLGGKPLNEGKIHGAKTSGPIFRSDAVNIENAEFYLLDGTFLGALNQLRTLSQ